MYFFFVQYEKKAKKENTPKINTSECEESRGNMLLTEVV